MDVNTIQIITTTITGLGVVAAIIFNIGQLKILNKQLRVKFFSEYTKRYQDIILNLPENINRHDFDFSNLEKDVHDKTMRYMRAYFDLCSEEYHLKKQNYINDDVWEIWKKSMAHAMDKKAFVEAWDKLKTDTKFDPEFVQWMDNLKYV